MIAFRGYTHISINIALFLILRDYFIINRPIGLVIIFLALGSVLADIDHPSSIIGKFFIPINAVVKHRNGYTHSLLGAFLFTVPILLIDKVYFVTALVGYISHLLVDTLTPAGVKWLFPFKNKSYSLKVARTGGPEEVIILGLSLLYIFKTKL
ncbi:metal-dependent hydrolase [Caloranaerobacter sp. DY30410]|uniref:metal-dependent hydrolase n=1 Tax=Caloranaerobacter sp. DY30410 TaxID=3238305 RepID=UPI003D06D363